MAHYFFIVLLALSMAESCNRGSGGAKDEPAALYFTAQCVELCNRKKGIPLDLEKFEKYGKYNPYDTVQDNTKDSTIISFSFISDCCLSFAGKAAASHDTLILRYGFDKDTLTPCDCYCDYRITYRIKKKGRPWSAMNIIYGKPSSEQKK